MNVEMDVMEDILMLLGNTGLNQELLLEIYIMSPIGVIPMLLHLVITTLSELLNHALLKLKPPCVNKNAEKDGKILMKMIKLMDKEDIDFKLMKIILKLNYSLMDQLKYLLPFMEISQLIKVEFIIMYLDKNLEDMLLN